MNERPNCEDISCVEKYQDNSENEVHKLFTSYWLKCSRVCISVLNRCANSKTCKNGVAFSVRQLSCTASASTVRRKATRVENSPARWVSITSGNWNCKHSSKSPLSARFRIRCDAQSSRRHSWEIRVRYCVKLAIRLSRLQLFWSCFTSRMNPTWTASMLSAMKAWRPFITKRKRERRMFSL